MLVGFETSDDATVYRLTDDLCVAVSIDVLTPVVDDPYDFGRVAAANSVSDLYAMGAEPKFAMSFAGFPRSKLPMSVLADISRGAAAICAEARMPIIGGHTVDDPEPKFGLSVTGVVHPDRIVRNSAGQPGDVLVLTKPLGLGVITTANKRDLAMPEEVAEAVAVMTTLNAAAARAMLSVDVRCATDVTGFGLLGHLAEVARGSGLSARIDYDAVPVLASARRLALLDAFPGGSRRNLAYLTPSLTIDPRLSETDALLLADAQTSGGLLIAVPASRLADLLAALEAGGVETRAVVGELVSGPAGAVTVFRH